METAGLDRWLFKTEPGLQVYSSNMREFAKHADSLFNLTKVSFGYLGNLFSFNYRRIVEWFLINYMRLFRWFSKLYSELNRFGVS